MHGWCFVVQKKLFFKVHFSIFKVHFSHFSHCVNARLVLCGSKKVIF